MRILTVVGARPNFMKAAPIINAINLHNQQLALTSRGIGRVSERIEHILVHTGQHYDELMSGSFFSDLNLPPPDIHLGVAAGSPVGQTAEIMTKFEPVLRDKRPDVVIVVGDVTSTLACALVASKVSLDSSGSKSLVVHVEAGLRSFDRSMPEETNRILTDHTSDVLFVTEPSGLQNLRAEGIPPGRIYFVGNTMIDSLLAFRQKAQASAILRDLGLQEGNGDDARANSTRPYALLTLHRPSNVDNREAFLNIIRGVEELAAERPVIFPVHPRTKTRLQEFDLRDRFCMSRAECDSARFANGIILTPPMGYLDFVCLMMHASIVITDSGGIQEETTCLGVPCVTVRENTERPVTVEIGTNVLAGTNTECIRNTVRQQIARKFSSSVPEKWDGQAAMRIVDVLVRVHREKALPELIMSRADSRQLISTGTFD